MRTLKVYVNGEPTRKHFPQPKGCELRTIFNRFNAYAKKQGFTTSQPMNMCIGYMGWLNENGDVMVMMEQ